MTGKDRIKKTFKLEPTDSTPWVPFVGVHGASLIGVNATEYLHSADYIVDGITKAVELYQPDGIPVLFDLQLEAELLGCKLNWSEENPPAVISHPLLEGKSLKDLSVPEKHQGRMPLVLDATRRLRSKYPDLALYGLIAGPFTLALHLLGTDIFMKIFEEPAFVTKLFGFCEKVSKRMTDYYIEAGCDVIAVVDPMTSQIDPVTFETFVSPPMTKIFDHIREKRALSSFFVCGHAQQNIQVMCGCKPDNISIDENIPLDYVKDIALRHNISFGGNLQLTVVLLMGTPEDAAFNALDCIELGGNLGFILAPGCDLPMATPPENLIAVTRLVKDPYERQIVKAMIRKNDSLKLLNMRDYGQTDKVIVDIITLDSESCAPCQYMVEAVKKIAPHFEGIVEWREHAIKQMEGVTFMASLMVKNIPTICIDGKISFVSQIPPKNELIAAIQKRINEKIKLKIQAKKGEFIVFCKDEDEIKLMKTRINTAFLQTGKNIDVQYVTDHEKLAEYGISQTPTVILKKYTMKSQGKVTSVDVISEWLKEV
jgi:MtaA/CmuA family methyltransferase